MISIYPKLVNYSYRESLEPRKSFHSKSDCSPLPALLKEVDVSDSFRLQLSRAGIRLCSSGPGDWLRLVLQALHHSTGLFNLLCSPG